MCQNVSASPYYPPLIGDIYACPDSAMGANESIESLVQVKCNTSSTPIDEEIGDYAVSGEILAFRIMLISLAVIGALGNLTVLYVFCKKNKENKLTAAFYVRCLAATDLIVCIIVIPSSLIMNYYNDYAMYMIICRLYIFFGAANFPFSSLLMCVISIDRCICICLPHIHTRYFNVRNARIGLFMMFLMTVAIAINPTLIYNVYESCLDANFNVQHRYVGRCIAGRTAIHFESIGTDKLPMFNMSFVALYMVVSLGAYAYLYHFVYARQARITARKTEQAHRLLQNSTQTLAIPTTTRNAGQTGNNHELHPLNSIAASDVVSSCGPSINSMDIPEPDEGNCFPSLGVSRGPAIDPATAAVRNLKRTRRRYNMRMALMLFVVDVTFIVTTLPAMLMIFLNGFLPFNRILFYMAYVNNVANPFIYGFLNQHFRSELTTARHRATAVCITDGCAAQRSRRNKQLPERMGSEYRRAPTRRSTRGATSQMERNRSVMTLQPTCVQPSEVGQSRKVSIKVPPIKVDLEY